jgi:hypothetical protein
LPTSSQAPINLSPSGAAEDERRELDAVAAAFRNSPRLSRLIIYIGEKYFQGKLEELHEYDIATEVFGRSKEKFNAGEDAIVRVEAHRLRKRLLEYYEADGKDHPVHLSIPPGAYIPVFTRQVASTANANLNDEKVSGPRVNWFWFYVIAAFVLSILSWQLLIRVHRAEKGTLGAVAYPVRQTAPGSTALYAQMPLRILAGYSGRSQIDSAGNVWQPDQYFHLGGKWDRPDTVVAGTSDPMLFKHWRNGNFVYEIPLRPGVYELHLYFVATEPDASGSLTFSVSVNGAPILSGFDVNADAFGSNIADERIFRDISPAGDGILHLRISGERGTATVSAIEILPGTPHLQLPIRLVAQQRSFTDSNGQFWHPDDHFINGYTATNNRKVEGTPDPDLFAAERYGHFTYAIPVDTRDRYTLVLHFAEFYFGPGASGIGGKGSRVFRVLCNGNTLLDNFDIYKEVGNLHAMTKTFYHLKPSAQGKLNITFEPIANFATISGIEVFDESR